MLIRHRLVPELMKAFPHAGVSVYHKDDADIITLEYGHMKTSFSPTDGLLNQEYDPQVMEQIIEIIRNLPNDVNVKYEEVTKEESRSI